MKDYYGTCWNCGRNFTKSRVDQLFVQPNVEVNIDIYLFHIVKDV